MDKVSDRQAHGMAAGSKRSSRRQTGVPKRGRFALLLIASVALSLASTTIAATAIAAVGSPSRQAPTIAVATRASAMGAPASADSGSLTWGYCIGGSGAVLFGLAHGQAIVCALERSPTRGEIVTYSHLGTIEKPEDAVQVIEELDSYLLNSGVLNGSLELYAAGFEAPTGFDPGSRT